MLASSVHEGQEPITLQEAKDWCGVDFEDEATNRTLTLLIKSADRYIAGAVGENYTRNDERAKLLALSIVDEWFNSRDKGQKVSAAVERMTNDFFFQLQLEERGKQESGSV